MSSLDLSSLSSALAIVPTISAAKGESQTGVAWTRWPIVQRGQATKLFHLPFHRDSFRSPTEWLEVTWGELTRVWSFKDRRPDFLLTDLSLSSLEGFDLLPLLSIQDFDPLTCELYEEAMGFFNTCPEASVFFCPDSCPGSTTRFVLKQQVDKNIHYKLVEGSSSLKAFQDTLVAICRGCVGRGPLPLAMVLASISPCSSSSETMSLLADKSSRPKPSLVTKPNTRDLKTKSKGLEKWKAVRNCSERCWSCGHDFCPHRNFPYYYTSHPAQLPTRFRCYECHQAAGGSYRRSTRLTDGAADEMLRRTLARVSENKI